MNIVCMALGHRRSRQWATYDVEENLWHSICLRCHERLTRDEDGRWINSRNREKEAA